MCSRVALTDTAPARLLRTKYWFGTAGFLGDHVNIPFCVYTKPAPLFIV